MLNTIQEAKGTQEFNYNEYRRVDLNRFAKELDDTSLNPTSEEFAGTNKRYIVRNDEMVEISSTIDQFIYVNKLIAVGNILFEDGCNATPDENAALGAYYKSKYKKISKSK